MPNAAPPRFDYIVKNAAIENNNKKYRGRSMAHLDKTELFKSRMITEKPQYRDLSDDRIRA